jgi:hypothetical protein
MNFSTVFLQRSLLFILRQEHDPSTVLPAPLADRLDIRLGDSREELVRQRGQHSGAVAGVGFAAAGAAMIHVSQNAVGIIHDLM